MDQKANSTFRMVEPSVNSSAVAISNAIIISKMILNYNKETASNSAACNAFRYLHYHHNDENICSRRHIIAVGSVLRFIETIAYSFTSQVNTSW